MILFFIALFAAGLFWFQKFLYRRFWAEGIRVEVSFQEEMVQAGEETALFEVVENRKWLPIPSLKVKFQCSRKLRSTRRTVFSALTGDIMEYRESIL